MSNESEGPQCLFNGVRGYLLQSLTAGWDGSKEHSLDFGVCRNPHRLDMVLSPDDQQHI